MDFLQLEWVQWLLGIGAGLVTLWVIPNEVWAKIVSLFGTKVAPILDKVATGLDGAGAMAEGAGLEKVAEIAYELADGVDEVEDLPRLIADLTADGDLSKDDLVQLLNEGKDVAVEGKDFYVKIIKKKPE